MLSILILTPCLLADEETSPLNSASGRGREPSTNMSATLNISSKRVMAMSPAAIPSTPVSYRSVLNDHEDMQSEHSKVLEDDADDV